MRLRDIRLQSFRNHERSRIKCASGRNVFLGNNGEGKTNILEAISYICLTKSFYSSNDATAVQIGQPGFKVSATAVSDIDVEYVVEVSYEKEEREKTITINKGVVEDKSSVVGMFPVVVLSPENANVTSGMPAERRRFMDVVISQSNKTYLRDLIEYRRILRQRNRILLDGKQGLHVSRETLDPWTENLVRTGSQVTVRRARFVQEFAPYLRDVFVSITGKGEDPFIEYEPSVRFNTGSDEATVSKTFQAQLEEQYAEEQKLGTTLVGPQKDELKFGINSLGLKSYASQGQHKTFLVAMKVAEFFFLRERCQETPILLLDDVFSELDNNRSEKVLAMTAGLGQTFITSTDAQRFSEDTKSRGNFASYYVHQGRVKLAEPAVFVN
jgi:DNA replication and repair protein RecF